jgi:ElaB/YqjD/DUF883 family membrane-anchored ribosome-binding protein
MSEISKTARSRIADRVKSSTDIVNDTKERLSSAGGDAADALRDLILEYPIHSVFIALGVGYVFGRRRSRRR